MGKRIREKFVFGTDYQFDLLKYTVLDNNGYKALQYYRDYYFDLIEHQFIAYTISQYWRKLHRIPGETLLKEAVIETFKNKKFATVLRDEDRKGILEIVKKLYSGNLRDADEIFNRCVQFKSYIELKNEVERVDLLNFDQYESFASKVLKAINITHKEDDFGTYLINGLSSRQLHRQIHDSIIPTPFRQINSMTNGGGYGSGSVLVIMDIPKQLKTAMMINVVRGYMRMRKKVMVIDLDNAKDDWPIRLEQSISNKNKKEVLSGNYDKTLQKTLRKYARMGTEVYIKRMQSGCTTADLQAVLDKEHQHSGFQPNILVIDFIGKMSSLSKKMDDHERILDAYQDVENFALNNGIDHVWSPHHVKNEAYARESTRYKKNDMAKCTALGGQVHAIFGLNRNDHEKDNNIVRMELVMQRDGIPNGRALFIVDAPTQRLDELTVAQRVAYDAQIKETRESSNNKGKTDLD